MPLADAYGRCRRCTRPMRSSRVGKAAGVLHGEQAFLRLTRTFYRGPGALERGDIRGIASQRVAARRFGSRSAGTPRAFCRCRSATRGADVGRCESSARRGAAPASVRQRGMRTKRGWAGAIPARRLHAMGQRSRNESPWASLRRCFFSASSTSVIVRNPPLVEKSRTPSFPRSAWERIPGTRCVTSCSPVRHELLRQTAERFRTGVPTRSVGTRGLFASCER